MLQVLLETLAETCAEILSGFLISASAREREVTRNHYVEAWECRDGCGTVDSRRWLRQWIVFDCAKCRARWLLHRDRHDWRIDYDRSSANVAQRGEARGHRRYGLRRSGNSGQWMFRARLAWRTPLRRFSRIRKRLLNAATSPRLRSHRSASDG